MTLLRRIFLVCIVFSLTAVVIPMDPDLYWDQITGGPTSENVRVIAVDDVGDLYVGGFFTYVEGPLEVNYITKYDVSAGTWSALPGPTGVMGVSYQGVHAIVIDGTDVYVGGGFGLAGGVPNTAYIAKWDGATWSPLGTGMDGSVYSMYLDGTDLYVGGSFTAAGGVANTSKLAKWNITTSAWESVSDQAPDNSLWEIQKDGSNLYIGGSFTNVGTTPANRIAVYNGASWSALGVGVGGAVYDIAIADNGDVYAGGIFDNAGGEAYIDYLAMWTGSAWTNVGTVPPGPSDHDPNNWVIALEWDDYGNLYAGGNFTQIGGAPAGNIAAWTGTEWKTLGSGHNGWVWAIAKGGSMWTGGYFTQAGGSSSSRVAHWTRESLPVELVAFDARRDGSDVLLTWRTATETNNAGFGIEHHGPDAGDTWADVGFIEGRGTQTVPSEYAYRITAVDPGHHQFRLRQVDYDGRTSYSETIEIDITLDRLYMVEAPYPNPFRESTNIRLAVASDQDVRITLHDVMGRQIRGIFDGELKANRMIALRLDGSELAGGTYILQLDGKTFSASEKVVVVR